jgi:hypothetical protein
MIEYLAVSTNVSVRTKLKTMHFNFNTSIVVMLGIHVTGRLEPLKLILRWLHK